MRPTFICRYRSSALFAACALVLSSAPARTDEPQVSTVRRTTIAAFDPEASLHFYRDLLGFTVEYDVESMDPAALAALAPGATKGRAIALRRGEKMAGSIGLFHTPDMRSGGACPATAAGGAVSMLLLTDDLAAMHRRLKTAAVPFANDQFTYDNSRGKGPIGTFTVFDPDCVRVTFAQIKSETFERSESR